jgi:hypothetical protein
MSKKQNKLPPMSYPGIGLIFGTGLGITFGPTLFGDVSIGLVFGSSFGLILGAIAYNQSKNKKDVDN